MIASVRGTVAALGPDGAVVEVGGFGLAVSCSPGTLARLRLGEPARLATSLVVREDSLTLYGFADDDERALFELLQTANGVGPKLAQTMLAVHAPRELRRAIATSDFRALTAVPGIGRKGAIGSEPSTPTTGAGPPASLRSRRGAIS
jgi:Holliday junction DNA helicase RuvA